MFRSEELIYLTDLMVFTCVWVWWPWLGTRDVLCMEAGAEPGRGSLMILDPAKHRLIAGIESIKNFEGSVPASFDFLSLRKVKADTARDPSVYPFVGEDRTVEEKLMYLMKVKSVNAGKASHLGLIDWFMRQEHFCHYSSP